MLDLSTNFIQPSPNHFPCKALIIADIDIFLDLIRKEIF